MKTNCELPLCMMHRNTNLNDYDFILYHLFISNEEYSKYYKNLHHQQPHRLTIFDNSAYEFFIKSEQLDLANYIKTIKEFNPDFYILPDVLMDKSKTLEMSYRALDLAAVENIASKPLAVAQGNTEKELVECLMEYYKDGIECVAIPFHNSFFKDMHLDNRVIYTEWVRNFGELTDDMKYAIGRINFINKNANILRFFDHVHLLGSHHPGEKSFYHYDFIKTMDTGYPVKCAIAGYNLFKEPSKPDIIIDEFLDKELTDRQKTLIDANVCKFKSI